MPLGMLAAVRRDSWIDHVARCISLIGVSSPTFWLAFIMLAIFYGGLQIAPGPGRLDPIAFPPATVTGLLPDRHASSPATGRRSRTPPRIWCCPRSCSRAATLGLITRTTRAGMLEALRQDYVRVARAKGLQERAIVCGHALPNALIPVVTLGGLAYANLLTGAVMTETIFSWPGLGRYTFRSAVALDFPAIMGITLIVARSSYLVINLLVDLSYALLDPRVVRVMTRSVPHRRRVALAPGGMRGQRWRRATGWPRSARRSSLAWIADRAVFAPWLAPYRPTSSM